MTDNDRGQFIESLLALAELHERKLSDGVMELYFKALADMTAEQACRACEIAAVSIKFFPKPVELREIILSSPDDRALLAWQALQVAYKRVGYWDSIYIYDAQTAGAMKRVFGGWVQFSEAVKNLSDEMLQAKRKEFMSTFRALEGRAEKGEYFAGQFECQNRETVSTWTRGTLANNVFTQEVGYLQDNELRVVRLDFSAETGHLTEMARAMLEQGIEQKRLTA